MMEALILFFSSIPNLLSFFIFFLIIYLIAYFLIFPSWKPKLRPEASSCIISFFHGTPAVFLAITSLLADPARDFHSPNTPFQNLVLDYSIAYFLMDLTHYLIFYPSDVLFIGHHVATLFVFVTCRYMVYHGAYAILVLLILAEVTSFVQNTWTLANARKADVEFAARVYGLLSPPFYVFYSLVRGIAGPYFVYKMISCYISGAADNVIPRWLWVSWVFVVVTAISVSILWVSNNWVELYRERSRKFERKVR
ncbi:TLC domain-containing protein At5g14285 [Lycium ferocissimum]|uniref:TLC domain-containing protein At5g14285 n=1 Tax=Lycium ferocissimum TaxID=112874 RepID=UPI00281630CC|nr:TLC domain-containing protein At5g14285 [Lycium ferocissimum]